MVYRAAKKRRGSEQGAVLVFGAQAIAILVALLVITLHTFNALTASVQARRITERVAASMVSLLKVGDSSCMAAEEQFQRLTEEGGEWSITLGVYGAGGFNAFTPEECDSLDVGNAFEISLEVDHDSGMIGLVPRIFPNQLTLRKVRILGYVDNGQGYLRVL